MLAFDGSATTRKGVEMLAASPAEGAADPPVMVGPVNDESSAQLDWAQKVLLNVGFTVRAETPERRDRAYLARLSERARHRPAGDGAYGHSRIRQFLVGSTTTSMLRTTTGPLLLLR